MAVLLGLYSGILDGGDQAHPGTAPGAGEYVKPDHQPPRTAFPPALHPCPSSTSPPSCGRLAPATMARRLSSQGDFAAVLERLSREARAPEIVSVHVSGSHAEGHAHRESNVDAGVLLRYETHDTARKRFEERAEVSSSLPPKLRLASMALVILNDAAPLLARRIVTRGDRISCTDPEADHDFVCNVRLRAADLEPFLRRTHGLKLAAIDR